jgi:uncharacterized membrane protein YdjX (TVP38/TMEM64 family)
MRLGALSRRLGQLGPLALAAALLPPLGSLLLIATLEPTSAWLRGHRAFGVAAFVIGFAVCGGFALLPTYTPSLLGGWAFGVTVGLAATLAGFLLAAGIGFALARRLSGERLMDVLREHPRGLAVHDAFVRSGFWKALLVVTLLRLPPNSPFAIGNLLMAASRVGPAPFLAGTLLGIAPRAGAAVAVGAGLARVDLDRPTETLAVLTGLAVTIGVAAALGWMANRALARVAPASRDVPPAAGLTPGGAPATAGPPAPPA